MGSTGTVDEADTARADLNDFTVGLLGGQTGTVTVRYNIVAINGVARFCPATNSSVIVRLRDEDGNAGNLSRVFFTIRRTNIDSGGNTVVYTFDSDVLAGNLGAVFQTVNVNVPNLDFDFANNVYWIEAQISRTNAAAAVELGSIQIAETAGTTCP
jgi:hypothetical protein